MTPRVAANRSGWSSGKNRHCRSQIFPPVTLHGVDLSKCHEFGGDRVKIAFEGAGPGLRLRRSGGDKPKERWSAQATS
jgi:hypothetical protein